MMMRSSVLALVVMGLGSTFGFVQAAPTPKGSAAPDLSYVDLDNDGERDATDLPLGGFLGPGKFGFNELVSQGGYRPAGRPVGIVVEGSLYFAERDALALFFVSGNVIVKGNITVRGADSLIAFTTQGGDVDIRPGVILKGNGELQFKTGAGGNITVGRNAQLSTRGDLADVLLSADGSLTVESGVKFSVSGSGYNDVDLHSVGPMSIASGVKFSGPSHGAMSLISATDLNLSNLNVRTGYIHILAYSDPRHPAAKRVHIRDSSLTQTYKNGEFKIEAYPDWNNPRYATDAIILDNVTLSVRTPYPIYSPEPVIQ